MKLTENTKVVYDDFTHTYLMGNKVLQGVTGLMKKHGLSANYGAVAPEVLEAAAARGSAVHKAIENYNNGDAVLFADTIYNGKVVLTADELKANLKAYQTLGIKAIASEFLISDNKLVASSIDIVADAGMDGFVDIIDTKTTSEVHKEALQWQLALYKHLLERQCRGIRVRNCYCAHIRKGAGRKIPITPVTPDKVRALFKAEEEGRIYQEEKTEALSVVSPAVLARIVKTDLAIADAKAKIKQLEDSVAMAKECLYQYMLEKGIKELDCEGGAIVLKSPTQRQGVDSKKLQAEFPDAYNACIKVSEVKGSITFKPK